MSMEWNKIFGAVLLAGLIAMLAGFVSEVLVHPHKLEKNAYVVAAPAGGTATDAKKEPTGPADIVPMLAAANVDAGKSTAKVCQTCHSFGKGEAAKVGPNLYGIVGNKHAHMEGFAYSDAMKSQQGPWTYEALNHFLYDPKAAVPGTKMTFAGLKKDEDRANVIAWLRTLSDNPVPLPAAK